MEVGIHLEGWWNQYCAVSVRVDSPLLFPSHPLPETIKNSPRPCHPMILDLIPRVSRSVSSQILNDWHQNALCNPFPNFCNRGDNLVNKDSPVARRY
jgi:hypothetical protein